ncbi:hypothetical protein Pfo_029725 [Paulownia fortunei]|nr:hypothetical protein Pfo_029725 [Paulownia fortunei]
MAARKRASATDTTKTDPEKPKPETHQTDSPIRPAKFPTIIKFFLIFSIPYFFLIFSYYKIEYELKKPILINLLVSFIGFFITVSMIPVASKYVLRRNLFGYDINKKGTPDGSIKVPESLGIVVGIVFLVVTILFQYFNFTADSNWLVEYNAALASICFMILLGFVDDVLDVPWRVKLVLPSIAALPLLMAYAGHTTIIIPKPLVPYVGLEILDLGMTMAVAGILGHFRFDPQSGLLTGTNDGTLVNFFLRQFGRKTEKSLCILLLVFQALCCGFCFLLRWFLTGWYK